MSSTPPWPDSSIGAPFGRSAGRLKQRLERAWLDSAGFRKALRLSLTVIYALVLREATTRYGRRSAGFVWAFIQPLIQLMVMLAIYAFIRNRTAAAGESLTLFFMTGIMPVFLVRSGLRQGAKAIRSNRGLMIYPQVGAFEVITGRKVLELVTSFCVFLIVMIFMRVFHGLEFREWLDRPLSLLEALCALAFLSYGLTFLSAQIGRMFDQWGQIASLLGRVLFFTSGVWFTLDSLPSGLRHYARYNPVAHVIEWIRDAAIPTFSSLHIDRGYPFAFGLVCLVAGLVIEWLHKLTGYDLVAGRRR